MGFLRSSLQSLAGSILPDFLRARKPTKITQKTVGHAPNGDWVNEITMVAPSGLTAVWLTYGATLAKLILPDGTNVVAGFEDPKDYFGDHPYLGSMIGPLSNRIRGAGFNLGDQHFDLPANEGENTLHSGETGWHRQVWDYDIVEDKEGGSRLTLSLFSQDRDAGFPSDSWTFLDIDLSDDRLTIKMRSDVARPSPIAPTLHPYFNPSGTFGTPMDDQIVWCPGTVVSEIRGDATMIGGVMSVMGTPLDLSGLDTPLGDRKIDRNYFVPDHARLRTVATLTDLSRYIYVESDMPCVQIFTGETLSAVPSMVTRGGVAVEPQFPPDAINAPVKGIDIVKDRAQPFEATIAYRFDGPWTSGGAATQF